MRKPSQTSLSRPAKSSRSPPPDASPPEAASKPAGGRADARRNRERLIEVAHEVFTERGADASLDEIARLAGVGIGTLYRHFPTRDDLLVATLEGRLTSLGHKARVLAEASSPSEALDVWLRAYLRHATTYRGLASSLPATLGCMSVACDQAQAGGAALLARAQAAGEIRLDIDFADIRDMVTAVAFAAQQSPDSPARTRRLLSLVLDGLRPPTPR